MSRDLAPWTRAKPTPADQARMQKDRDSALLNTVPRRLEGWRAGGLGGCVSCPTALSAGWSRGPPMTTGGARAARAPRTASQQGIYAAAAGGKGVLGRRRMLSGPRYSSYGAVGTGLQSWRRAEGTRCSVDQGIEGLVRGTGGENGGVGEQPGTLGSCTPSPASTRRVGRRRRW